MKRHLASVSRSTLALAAMCGLWSTAVFAQDKKEEAKWDVNAPPGLTIREIPISVDEGTWMNVDVSPDGSRIAFDMLGDIYTMPIAGGTPTRIAEAIEAATAAWRQFVGDYDIPQE